MTIAIDGQAFSLVTSGLTTGTVTLTTATAGDLIYVFYGSGATSSVATIADVAGLTWTLRPGMTGGLNSGSVFCWTATAPSALSGDIITITNTSGMPFDRLQAIGISGANTTSPFDPNLSAAPASSAGDPVAVTTTNANDILLGFALMSTNTPTAGSGFTLLTNPGGAFYGGEEKVVSTTQTALSVGWTTGTGTSAFMLVDAIVAASGGGGGLDTRQQNNSIISIMGP